MVYGLIPSQGVRFDKRVAQTLASKFGQDIWIVMCGYISETLRLNLVWSVETMLIPYGRSRVCRRLLEDRPGLFQGQVPSILYLGENGRYPPGGDAGVS